ncbi:MAG: hypothetical protein RIR62_63 [Pseudomonadota bacterium]|jgi:hypothetical protein
MVSRFLSVLVTVQSFVSETILIGIAVLTGGLGLYLVAGATGLLPWPEVFVTLGGQPVGVESKWLLVAGFALLLVLTLFLPANLRMTRLERSHRSFALTEDDIARAYRSVHAADRRGVFTLAGEFEAMKERIDHLRRHPDLSHLEPELLETAARMSLQSRDLAKLYSDDRVERARMFLRQRQEEVALFSDRIRLARATCDELRRWTTDIQAEEHQQQVQLKRLEADLREILPTLGYDFDDARGEHNVVSLPKPQK